MPEKINIRRQAAEHFGYTEVSGKCGCWKNEPGVLERIRSLPDVLNDTKKFRVIIDYDPEFSRVLVQVIEGGKTFSEVFAERTTEYRAILDQQAKRDIGQE